MKKNLILTGSLGSRPFKKYAYFSIYKYAKKVNADVFIASDIPIPDELNNFSIGRSNNKAYIKKLLWVKEALESYDKVLWLDDTCYVNPICPNLFDQVPAGYVAAVPNSIHLDISFFMKNYSELMFRTGLDYSEIESCFNSGVVVYTKEVKHLFDTDNLKDKFSKVAWMSHWPEQMVLCYLIVKLNIPRIILDSKYNRMNIDGSYEPYTKYNKRNQDFLINKKLLEDSRFKYESFIYHAVGRSPDVRLNSLKAIHNTFSNVAL